MHEYIPEKWVNGGGRMISVRGAFVEGRDSCVCGGDKCEDGVRENSTVRPGHHDPPPSCTAPLLTTNSMYCCPPAAAPYAMRTTTPVMPSAAGGEGVED